jgi:hypothetical protein
VTPKLIVTERIDSLARDSTADSLILEEVTSDDLFDSEDKESKEAECLELAEEVDLDSINFNVIKNSAAFDHKNPRSKN